VVDAGRRERKRYCNGDRSPPPVQPAAQRFIDEMPPMPETKNG
jgi:hypothetical protein